MTQNMPPAEVDIDEGLVRGLLAEQRPDLADQSLGLLSFGWDNVSMLIGDHLVARLPRRDMAVGLIENEARWLPELASRLPLPVPVPRFVGAPGAGYPWPWSITDLVPGSSVALASALDLEAVASQMGGFLKALHAPAPDTAPDNPYRGVPLGERDDVTRERLERVSTHFESRALVRGWESALSARPHPSHSPLWLHGDLHPHNLLQAEGILSGVVDFGDITAGDPATDLAIGWSLLTSKTRPLFWDAYGAADDALILRARGWAISLGSAYLAHSADNPTMAEIGRRALAEVISEL